MYVVVPYLQIIPHKRDDYSWTKLQETTEYGGPLTPNTTSTLDFRSLLRNDTPTTGTLAKIISANAVRTEPSLFQLQRKYNISLFLEK
jgi:hypothetical protein